MKRHLFAFLLISTAIAGCGPGAFDGQYEIAGGYALFETSSDGRSIVYRRPDTGSVETVVSPRIDAYVLDGDEIIVARRPAETRWRGQIPELKLLNGCEYWVIHVRTHTVARIPDANRWPGIRCE